MFYCLLLLFMFSFFLILRGYRNRYCWIFLIMLAGMIISFFSIFMYLTLFNDYIYGERLFFPLDYFVFRFVQNNVKLPLSILARVMNAGLGIYLLAVPLFVFEFTNNKRYISAKIIFLLVFIVYFLLFYDPECAWRIYIRYHLGEAPLKFSYIIDLVHQFNQIGLILYLFYPSWLLYVYVQETGIKFIRDQIILLAVCLIVMTIFFYGVVFFSPFVVSMDNAINYGFWIYYNISSIKTYYIVLPLVTASALTLVFFSFFNFRLGHTVHLFTDRRTDQTVTQINEILSDSLHSQKNLLFSINILARGAVEEAALAGGTGKLKEKIKKIDEISRSSLDKISEQLDSLRDIRIKVKNQGLVDLIERAAEKVNRPQHISIFKNYRARDRRDLVCRLDQFHIIQAFVNILTNAVEAIETASRDEGLIVITVTSQFQWVVVSIHDNGIGIRKKSLKHIFEPWYSEKGGSHNKGLGLSYVSKIIKAHNGFVQFESKYGEGTKVYIMVPKSGGRGERNG